MKNLTPYLDQTLAVLSRTVGAPPSRVRAVGFLREKLREHHGAAKTGDSPTVRADRVAADSPAQPDRG